jgi:hypothetical protein
MENPPNVEGEYRIGFKSPRETLLEISTGFSRDAIEKNVIHRYNALVEYGDKWAATIFGAKEWAKGGAGLFPPRSIRATRLITASCERGLRLVRPLTISLRDLSVEDPTVTPTPRVTSPPPSPGRSLSSKRRDEDDAGRVHRLGQDLCHRRG